MTDDLINMGYSKGGKGAALSVQPVCTGAGPDGEHCCQIDGQVCEFLVEVKGVPRCSLWDVDMRGSVKWQKAPVGKWFERKHPGLTCKDWPQNIPEVMSNPTVGKCCWERVL